MDHGGVASFGSFTEEESTDAAIAGQNWLLWVYLVEVLIE